MFDQSKLLFANKRKIFSLDGVMESAHWLIWKVSLLHQINALELWVDFIMT